MTLLTRNFLGSTTSIDGCRWLMGGKKSSGTMLTDRRRISRFYALPGKFARSQSSLSKTASTLIRHSVAFASASMHLSGSSMLPMAGRVRTQSFEHSSFVAVVCFNRPCSLSLSSMVQTDPPSNVESASVETHTGSQRV